MEALFRLEASTARLLLDAKDRQDPLAIEVLQWLCSYGLPQTLAQATPSISHVMVAPVRLQRLGAQAWHPALTLAQVAKAMFPKVLAPFITGISRQTLLIKTERQANPSNEKLLFTAKENALLHDSPKGILFIDDVMTSGSTARRTRLLLPRAFQEAPWHSLTLFRTPQARATADSPTEVSFSP